MIQKMRVNLQRESGIELLRIIAILGVIIIHYNQEAMTYTSFGSASRYMQLATESICYCAVNIFILISGYFLVAIQKRSIFKLIGMLLQVILFRLGTNIITYVLSGESSWIWLLGSIVPANYFVILYITVYLLSPYVNIILHRLTKKQFKRFLILLITIFSVWNIIVDLSAELLWGSVKEWNSLSTIGMHGAEEGFTSVNFMLMYIIGAYLRMHVIGKTEYETKRLILMLIGCVALIFLWAILNEKTGFFKLRSAWEYCNPFIIAEAVLLFLIFKKLHIENGAINIISKGVFTCFLTHSIFLPYIGIEYFVKQPIYILALHMLGTAVILFIVCYCIYFVYNIISQRLLKTLKSFLLNKGIKLIVFEDIKL